MRNDCTLDMGESLEYIGKNGRVDSWVGNTIDYIVFLDYGSLFLNDAIP